LTDNSACAKELAKRKNISSMVKHEQSQVESAIDFLVATAGSHDYGGLGRDQVPQNLHAPIPIHLSRMKSVKIVSSYGYHFFLLCVNQFGQQELYGTGWNHCGELNIESKEDVRESRTVVPIFKKFDLVKEVAEQGIAQISCSYFYTAFLTETNRVYVFGDLRSTSGFTEISLNKQNGRRVTKIASSFYDLYILYGKCFYCI
jgi:alpha-tubulin suppressor-like RCC1 family protein